jgi:prolyl-tRNA editing enzyme YbaK/EbsC (Cys-tRNA(Pro) deacylase)/predicted Fe-S protein YdhL (DUF1289 family)
MSTSIHSPAAEAAPRPEGFQRVAAALQRLGHGAAPLWLEVAARTSQEAADALGVSLGQIAKSVVFRRLADDRAVLVIASGDRRVDEQKLSSLAGPVGRADAQFVKSRTGFAIGGVSPVGLLGEPTLLLDRELQRFDQIWAAAGHPNGVFRLTPQDLLRLTGAPWADVVGAAGPPGAPKGEQRKAQPEGAPLNASPHGPVPSPCINVCRMDAATGWCEGCLRTLPEIAAWGGLPDEDKRAVWRALPARRIAFGRRHPARAAASGADRP